MRKKAGVEGSTPGQMPTILVNCKVIGYNLNYCEPCFLPRYIDSLRLGDYKIEDIKTPPPPPKLSSTSFLSGSSKGTIGRRVMRKDSSRFDDIQLF